MKATPEAIDLWLACYDEITDPELHLAYRGMLDPVERIREPRFYFARDRLRYLVTRAMVRLVLSSYVEVAPQDWRFSANAHGRPFAVNTAARAAGLTFNISHTRDMIVVAVTANRVMGVDVENVIARPVSIGVAHRFFSPSEATSLAAISRDRQQYRFFEYWTFKESYIKARGLGLSLPLDKFSFHYPDEHRVALSIDPGLADDAGRWQFWQFQPRPDYLVALCAERIDAPATRINVRQIVPAVGEITLAPNFLRTSE